MKLTTILLLVACIQLSATGLTQTVSITVKDAPLLTVLKEIKKQTGYFYLADNEWLQKAQRVTLTAVNWPLLKVLDECFKGQPLTYNISGKVINIIPREEKTKEVKVINEIPPIDVKGRVVNENVEAVAGVTVVVKGTNITTITDSKGEFILQNIEQNATLVFTHISMETSEIKVNGKHELVINLQTKINELSNVTISANTGYQEVPKERATGSFDVISNELVNRRVSTTILDRLEGIASGVRFQTNIPSQSNESSISIRGRSTIFSNTKPLIVVDNFPYDGDINNINPNDVENISILKDAAAASIWGKYSGNGVIVITTKKGKLNQSLRIEENSNVTVGGKPDLFYSPSFINSSDFIDLEIFLFSNGAYAADLNSISKTAVSPVVEILARRKAGLISPVDSASQINQLREVDVRKDFAKYFYRKSVYQQHSINLAGGSSKTTYRISIGYDKNVNNLVNNDYDRLSLRSLNTFTPLKNLELAAGLSYIQSTTNNNNPGYFGDGSIRSINMGTGKGLYPYARLADADGTPLTVVREFQRTYKDTAGAGKLLDWNYRPLEEINISDNATKLYDIVANVGCKYSLLRSLNAEIIYQYERQTINTRNQQSISTYNTRSLINRFAQITNSSVSYPIPLGGILDATTAELKSSRFRGIVSYNNTFSKRHEISALAGIETSEVITNANASRLWGYDENNMTTTSNLDFRTRFTVRPSSSTSTIPYLGSVSRATDENVSYFANAGYTYNRKYILTASARKDQSNIFGVDFNHKGVPLWSLGAAWKISSESFYHAAWVPYLKLRATYGYNGNSNSSVVALLTANYASVGNDLGLNYGTVTNPPNSKLGWEKISTLNIGLDFELRNKIIAGSIDYYIKKGLDLIGQTPVAPSSGFSTFSANVANMKGKGIDVELNSLNINTRITWLTNFLFSYNLDRVSKYKAPIIAAQLAVNGDGSSMSGAISPIEGKPVYGIYSYAWKGLDPTTGDPLGQLNKTVSKDWTSIYLNTPISEMVYSGPARPRYFGAFRNTFSYGKLSLSINITYKLGYYFRRSSINYNNLFGSYAMHKDFIKRWQKPGDEEYTTIPSMIYPNTNSIRDVFYQYSSTLVEKGDHIRLQDIQIAYAFNKKVLNKLRSNNIQIYLYANNLGIIWKANKAGLDPDFANGFPNPKTISLGIKSNF